MVQHGVCRRPPLTPLTQRRNLEANFFSVSRNVVLARSLFIASPPPSRSSISDANSCKLPSSLCLMPHASLPSSYGTRVSRGLDRTTTPSRNRTTTPSRNRRAFAQSGINRLQSRNYFEKPPEISGIIDIYLRRNRSGNFLMAYGTSNAIYMRSIWQYVIFFRISIFTLHSNS